MAFFGNKRKDFSIQPPRQQVDGTPFFVTDSANIDFTLANLNLTANLTQLLPTSGTYGSPTLIPILDIDEFGRVTGVSTTTFSASGIALEVNGTPNLSQTILNLVDSATIEVVDLGGGDIEFNYIGSGGTYTVENGLEPKSGFPNTFQLGGALTKNTTISTVSNYQLTISAPNTQNSSQPFGVTTQGDAGAASFSNSGAGKTVTIAKSNSDTAAGILYLNKSGGAANAEELFILMKKNGANTANASIKIDTYIDDSLGSQTISSSIITRAIDTVAATYTTNLEFWLSYNNNFSNAFTFKGTGQLQLNKYTAPFSGTAVYALGVDASGNVITTTGGSGTVTSVAATVPNPTNPAFSVSVPNPTTTPSVNITANGIVSQYIRGDGSLANFPTTGGGGSSVSYYLNGSVNQGAFGGSTYYQMSKTPVLGSGTTFTRPNSLGNGLIAQFMTDANDPSLLSIPGGNWNLELFFRASSGGGSPSYYVELYKYDTIGLTFTLIATDVLTPEGITNGTVLDAYFTALAVPTTPLAVTDRLALRIFVNTSGKTIELHTENGHLCQIITTFTTGLTALNGLTDQIQNFATPGTTGTAPSWSSVSPTHTLNIPLASTASVTAGLISKVNYDTFNGKQDALTDTKSVKIVSNNVELDGDNATPGNNKVYGTDASGVRGWKADPTGGGDSIGQLTGDVVTILATSSTEVMSSALAANYKKGSTGVVFDGADGVITANTVAYVQVPYSGTITAWTIVSKPTAVGTCTVTAFKLSSYPPTTPTNNIFNTQPALTGTAFNQDLTPDFVLGQDVVTAGDWIGFRITLPVTVTWVNLTLSITKIV